MYIYSLPDPAVHADPIFPSFLLFSPLLEVTATVWWWCPPSFYLLIVEIKNLTFTGDGDLQAGDCLSDTTSSRGILARRETLDGGPS